MVGYVASQVRFWATRRGSRADISLTALNCRPVRFKQDANQALVQDFPHGLNCKIDYHFIFVDIDLVSDEILKGMQKLQTTANVGLSIFFGGVGPHTQFIFLVRSIDLARATKEFGISVRLRLLSS